MAFNRGLGLGIVVGVGIGTSGVLLWNTRRPHPTTEQKLHKVANFGLPSVETRREFENLVLDYDTRTKSPLWVSEHICRDSPRISDRKNTEFKEDETFEERFRSKLSDYRSSGYDRGHMAPAANHKTSQSDMDSTFLLSNISPQVGKGFNRDYWARFEAFVRSLSYTCDDVYIVTGPLFLPSRTQFGLEMRHPMIGRPPNLVSVPTHFFKVVLGASSADSGGSVHTLGAFVMPNAAIDPDLPLTAFAVPLEPLEALSGLHFFPKLMTTERRLAHDSQALQWQRKGRQVVQQHNVLKQSVLLNPTGLLTLPTNAVDSLALLSPPVLEILPPSNNLAAKELPIGVLDAPQPLAQSSVEASVLPRIKQDSYGDKNLLHRDCATSQPLEQPVNQPTPESPSTSGMETSRSVTSRLSSEVFHRLEDQQLSELPIADIPLSAQTGKTHNSMLHLCDHVKCKLPPPNWYLKGKSRQSLQQPVVSNASIQEASPKTL